MPLLDWACTWVGGDVNRVRYGLPYAIEADVNPDVPLERDLWAGHPGEVGAQVLYHNTRYSRAEMLPSSSKRRRHDQHTVMYFGFESRESIRKVFHPDFVQRSVVCNVTYGECPQHYAKDPITQHETIVRVPISEVPAMGRRLAADEGYFTDPEKLNATQLTTRCGTLKASAASEKIMLEEAMVDHSIERGYCTHLTATKLYRLHASRQYPVVITVTSNAERALVDLQYYYDGYNVAPATSLYQHNQKRGVTPHWSFEDGTAGPVLQGALHSASTRGPSGAAATAAAVAAAQSAASNSTPSTALGAATTAAVAPSARTATGQARSTAAASAAVAAAVAAAGVTGASAHARSPTSS